MSNSGYLPLFCRRSYSFNLFSIFRCGCIVLLKAAENLEEAEGIARTFDLSWENPAQLGIILEHHLLFLGIRALLLVGKAIYWGGLNLLGRII